MQLYVEILNKFMLNPVQRTIFSFVSFIKEVRTEMKRMNWLDRQDIVRYTAVVFGLSFFVAAYLGALDFVFSWILRTFII